ncbi:MAG: putative toxin-antitoxin system toxin component, PIN family, partial [Candidatus Micrarchaeota archaeon]
VELITSESVIEEILDVLQRKFPNKVGLIEEFLKLSEIQVILKNDYYSTIEKQIVRDLEDRHVLAAAINSNCKFIVTGDKDLKVLKNYKGIEIITSKKLLEMTKTS